MLPVFSQFELKFREQKGLSATLVFYINEYLICRDFIDNNEDPYSLFCRTRLASFFYSYLHLLTHEYYRLIRIIFSDRDNDQFSIVRTIYKIKKLNNVPNDQLSRILSVYQLYEDHSDHIKKAISIRDKHIAHVDNNRFSLGDNIYLIPNDIVKVREILLLYLDCEEMFSIKQISILNAEEDIAFHEELRKQDPSIMAMVEMIKEMIPGLSLP